MAIYYIDGDNGNDNNNGTSPATAWRTITKALNTLSAGNKVYIKPGVYRERFAPVNSGSNNNYIEYIGDINGEYWGVKGDVIITNLATNWDTVIISGYPIDISNKNYIRISKITFILTGTPYFNNATYIDVLDCRFYIYKSGTIIITGNSNSINFLRNLFFTLIRISSGMAFLSLGSTPNAVFANNIFLLCAIITGGFSLNFYATSASNTNNIFENNIIYMTGYLNSIKSNTNIGDTFRNNIIFANSTDTTYISVWTNNYGFSGTGNLSPGLILLKPEFSVFDVSNLKDLLPPRNGTDYYGNPRTLGQGTDIGAIEWNPYPQREQTIKRSGNYSVRLERASFIDKKVWLTQGQHTISVYTRWSGYEGSNKPQLIVKQDNYCGINSNLVAEASGDGSDWEQLSITFTLTRDALVEYRLLARDTGINAVTYFDDDTYT